MAASLVFLRQPAQLFQLQQQPVHPLLILMKSAAIMVWIEVWKIVYRPKYDTAAFLIAVQFASDTLWSYKRMAAMSPM